MGLVDLQTDLKSLRYGKDRPFGGSSNQPYIQRDIDVRDSEVGRTGGPDFLLRGGTLVPRRVANDVSRMTQMLFDLKTPNGPLFTAKQNVLSLTSTNFKAGPSTSNINVGGTTLGDFLRNNIGFDKNNVYNPLSTIVQTGGGFLGLHLEKQGLLPPILGPSRYEDYIKDLDSEDGRNSRLVSLTRGTLTSNDPNLFEYIGGPGSVNGVGRTRIRRYEDTNIDNGYTNLQVISDAKSLEGKGNTNIIDFRQEPGGSKVKTLDYSDSSNRIEQRVNLGNPGRKGVNRTNYQEGLGEALDKLNAMPLYKGQFVADNEQPKNDLVKFRIGVIQNSNPSEKVYLHFRAFLDSLSDSYTSEWNDIKLMGRGESFYKYNGFTRTVSLAWTVAAQSKQELIPQYQKLNYLASSLAPDYSNIGYMSGNLVTLTLGGWFYEQPGIITSMTLDVPQESPWEIAIPAGDGGNPENPIKSDPSVKEMPHYVRVTGFNFIPIHKFAPKIQTNIYDGLNSGNGGKYVSDFGPQRYISLSNGSRRGDNNYDRQEPLKNNIQTTGVQPFPQPTITTSGDINDLRR